MYESENMKFKELCDSPSTKWIQQLGKSWYFKTYIFTDTRKETLLCFPWKRKYISLSIYTIQMRNHTIHK